MKVRQTNLLLPLALLLALVPKLDAQATQSDQQAITDKAWRRIGIVSDRCKLILATIPAPSQPDIGRFKPDCDSTQFYFGIGRKRDFVAARQCAFAERTNPERTESDIFAGPGVLSMLYANGEGIARDTPLARRFVCENQPASTAELENRLDLLDKIDNSREQPHFDICDTATSGLSEGECASIFARKANLSRAAEISDLTANLSPAAKTAFSALQQVEAAYENAHGENEVDTSGTGRMAFSEMASQDAAEEFLDNLRSLQQPPSSASRNAAESDRRLNQRYALLRRKLPPTDSQISAFGSINFAGVQKTERLWLQLRDNWMEFIRIAYPSYPRDAFLTRLTVQRTQTLNSVLQLGD